MPLPSLFKRKDPVTSRRKGAAENRGAVEEARVKARRRLIGAVVLLAAGIVVFPLIFETQPRPMALDTPIEVPKKERDLTVPAPTPQPRPAPAKPVTPIAEVPLEPPTEAPASAAATVAAKPVPAPAPSPTPAAPPRQAPEPAVAKADDGSRAKALLDDDAVVAAAAKSGRFVVQVGAYTDANALRDARQKVEKLGLKTYTQVVETDGGKRTRVRVGPFATREEADSAGAKLKSAGLPAAVLTL